MRLQSPPIGPRLRLPRLATRGRHALAAGTLAALLAGSPGRAASAGVFERLVPRPHRIVATSGRVDLAGPWILSVPTNSRSDSIAALELAEEAARRGWRWRIKAPTPGAREVVWQRIPGGAPEGYRLTLSPDRILVSATTETGRFYAMQTLRQILRISEAGRVPAATIEDAPTLATRAISLDISRGQVPTTESLKRTLRTLSYYKLNALFLYIEDSFAFPSAPRARATDRLDDRDVRELQLVADSFRVALVPIVQSLSHHELLLGVPEYNRFAENPRPRGFLPRLAAGWLGFGLEAGSKAEPAAPTGTICPTDPASVAFAHGLIRDVAGSFRSGRIHVGGDEAGEVGTGRSREAVRKRGRSAVLGAYFTQVRDLLYRQGRRMMVYSDMIDASSRAAGWPRDVDLVVWDYSPSSDFARADSLARLGFDSILLSSGIWDWKSFYPDAGRGFASIASAASAARRMRGRGTLTSSWGDGGAENLPQGSWSCFAFSASSAWETRPPEPREFLDRFARTYLGHGAAPLAEVERLVGWQAVDGLAWNGTTFHRRPRVRPRGAAWLERMHRLESDMVTAQRMLREHSARVSVNADHLDALGHAIHRYAHLAHREIALHELAAAVTGNERAAGAPSEAKASLEQSLVRLIREHAVLSAEYRGMWLRDCRPAGLESNLRRLDEQRAELRGILARLKSGSLAPWRPGDSAPVGAGERDSS